MRVDVELVRRYYDRHTAAFLALGQGGQVGALHRAVWGPGVTSRPEAFRYVERRIAELTTPFVRQRGHAHLLDLGCGVGASLCYLAQRLPVTGTGITLSPRQASLARARIEAAGLASRVQVIAGDFSAIDAGVPPADVAFAIESFVHAPDAACVLGEWARLVKRGGALVICDDFLRRDVPPRAEPWVERFRRGWHVNTLITTGELGELARRAGFVHITTEELTPYLEIGRWRDRVLDMLAPALEALPRRWGRLDPLLGGAALQRCLRWGWIGYDLVIFRRS
jgi:SAM-dependent methyltransferase